MKISQYQNLSENFIKKFCFEFCEKIYWEELKINKQFHNKQFDKNFFKFAPRYAKLYITLNHRNLFK